jgi:inhibitor of KinA sporulation pathway (predicted exonuclease)
MKEFPTDNLQIKTPLHNEEVIKKFGRLEEKQFVAVIDLELTCWDETDPNKQAQEKSEIIEIGIVVLDATTSKEIHRISRVCKPMYYPTLSEYCTNLTSITQEEINNARNLCVEFSIIQDDFPIFLDQRKMIWAAWGKDVAWLESEINKKTYKECNKKYFDPRVINVATISKKLGVRGGLKSALSKLKIPQELPAHRALPDAISTVKVYQALKLSPLEASVSNEKTYIEAIKKKQLNIVEQLCLKTKLDPSKASKLLNYTSWDYQKALNIFKLLS